MEKHALEVKQSILPLDGPGSGMVKKNTEI